MIFGAQFKMETQIPLFKKQKEIVKDTKILFKTFSFLPSNFSLDQSAFNLLFNVVFSPVGGILGKA